VFEHSFLMLGTCSNRPVKDIEKIEIPSCRTGSGIPIPWRKKYSLPPWGGGHDRAFLPDTYCQIESESIQI